VCLFTVHVGSGSSPLSCGVFLPPPLLQAFALLIAGCVLAAPACWRVCLQLMWEVGVPPSSCRVFFPLPLLQAFSLLVAGCVPPLPPSPARPGLFIYSSGRDFPPPSLVLRVPYPLCNVSLLFLLPITQFLFFSLGGGRSVQGAMLIWPRVVCGSTVYHLGHFVVCVPQAIWARPSGSRLGTLLVSPFNVKWRCSAQAGGVEGSKFCLFLVALPARCVSSISPRFHFWRHAFFFLPLATIFCTLNALFMA
jgi:hypothetical protein